MTATDVGRDAAWARLAKAVAGIAWEDPVPERRNAAEVEMRKALDGLRSLGVDVKLYGVEFVDLMPPEVAK